jgi:hypothetical protein
LDPSSTVPPAPVPKRWVTRRYLDPFHEEKTGTLTFRLGQGKGLHALGVMISKWLLDSTDKKDHEPPKSIPEEPLTEDQLRRRFGSHFTIMGM